MKIIGETAPLTGRDYQYKLVNDKREKVAVKEWQVVLDGIILKTNSTGEFVFNMNLAMKTLKILAFTSNKTYALSVSVVMGSPTVSWVEWQDIEGKPLKGRKVGYLDKVRLCIQTQNIRKGEKLTVTIYEDQFLDGHGLSSTTMGTYQTIGVNKNGRAYLLLNNIKVYRGKLNVDFIDESEHEYYVRIVYNKIINIIRDDVLLIVQNELKQYIKTKQTNTPVKVGTPKPPKKNTKKEVDITFNLFFDGTQNNKQNTFERHKNSEAYRKFSNKKDDSYMNELSNVAILDEIAIDSNHMYKIYNWGIGSNVRGKDEKSVVGLAIMADLSDIGDIPKVEVDKSLFSSLKGRIEWTFSKMEKIVKIKYSKNKIKTATFNIFGFSRGATTARYFMSLENRIKTTLQLDSIQNIIFNFVGLFDTVASFGFLHYNDVEQLNLTAVSKAKKVVHLIAANEYREYFALSDISSAIKKGVGYELVLPGAHSDIGGGYPKIEEEVRFLDSEVHPKKEFTKEINATKGKYMESGWYTIQQLEIEEGYVRESGYVCNLYGKRKLTNEYQYISLKIMKYFCEKYTKMSFNESEFSRYRVKNSFLQQIEKELYEYAIANDSASKKIASPNYRDLKILRNKFLHISHKKNELFLDGRLNNKGELEREIKKG